MSKESWLAEFYPESAEEPKTAKAATEHALRKWNGLLRENLIRHECAMNERNSRVCENGYEVLIVDGATCALCAWLGHTTCVGCPISECTGDECNTEFMTFRKTGNPKPMIELLEKTLTWVNENDNK